MVRSAALLVISSRPSRDELDERLPAGQTVTDRDRECALAAEAGERGVEEGSQVREPRERAFLPNGVALPRAMTVDLGLDLEQGGDPSQRLLGDVHERRRTIVWRTPSPPNCRPSLFITDC